MLVSCRLEERRKKDRKEEGERKGEGPTGKGDGPAPGGAELSAPPEELVSLWCIYNLSELGFCILHRLTLFFLVGFSILFSFVFSTSSSEHFQVRVEISGASGLSLTQPDFLRGTKNIQTLQKDMPTGGER